MTTPRTLTKQEESLRKPALCELLPVREYLDGVMVQVGVPPEPMSLRMFPLLDGRRSLAGSPIGGIAQTQEMLDVAAEHGFGADIETVDASYITEAHDRVVAGDVRYRFVIDIASMR